MTLPTLFELGVQKGQGVHHVFQNKNVNIEIGRFVDICWCGKDKGHRVHSQPPPKVKKPKPWEKNLLETITDIEPFLAKMKRHRRFKVFYHKGVKCVRCDRRGTKVVKYLENKNDPRSVHYDLFTEDDVMMTVDHIIPKYHNGSSDLDNLQPMCGPCNFRKGCKLD